MITLADESVLAVMLSAPRVHHNIRELSKISGVNYRLVYESVMKLYSRNVIHIRKSGKNTLCELNTRENHVLYSYIEFIRLKKFAVKYRQIGVIFDELNKLKCNFYTVLVFGSYAKGIATSKSDIDMMFIIPDSDDLSEFGKASERIFNKLNYDIHMNIVTEIDFVNMLGRPKELNGANEALDNHIILYGGEQFYRMVGMA